MSQIIFGIRIILNSNAAAVTNTYGLASFSTMAAANSAIGAATVTLNSVTSFLPRMWLSKTGGDIIGCIKSINRSTKVITLFGGAYVAVATDEAVRTCGDFLWSQVALTDAVTGTPFYGDVIVEKGIDSWTRQIDTQYGGNIENNTSCQATVKNTAQFSQTLKDLDINLIGKRAELWRFDGTAGSFTGSLQKVFQCQEPEWDSTTYVIPFLGMRERRDTVISPIITKTLRPKASTDSIGNRFPVSFGYMPKRKLINTTKSEKIYNNREFNLLATPAGITQFPVISAPSPPAAATLVYTIQLSLSIDTSTRTALSFVGKYMRVVSGSKSVGEMRRIASVVDTSFGEWPEITLDTYFTETLIGAVYAPTTDNAWVEIVEIDGSYECDTIKCKSFTDDDGNEITQGVRLYAYSEDQTVTMGTEATVVPVLNKPRQYFQLPQYIYDRSADAENNSVDIDAKQFSSSPNQADAFNMTPFRNGDIKLLGSAADFALFWPTSPYSTAVMNTRGIFSENAKFVRSVELVNPGLFINTIDKNSTTSTEFSVEIQKHKDKGPQFISQAFELSLPPPPVDFDFDSVYLMISGYSVIYGKPTDAVQGFNHTIFAAVRKFLGPAATIVDEDFAFESDNLGTRLVFDNAPDYYYTDVVDTKNKNFYASEKITGTNYPRVYNTLHGRSYWKLPNISDVRTYNAMYKAMIAFSSQIDAVSSDSKVSTFVLHTYLTELALMFHKSAPIKDAVYSPHKGRIYINSFEGRRAPTDMINGPSNIIEHVARLQNYSDLERLPGTTYGWGETYSDAVQIATLSSAEGGFDADEITADLSFTADISNELFDEGEMHTTEIKKTICREFFYGSFENAAGQECLRKLKRTATSPSETITLADIIDRRSIKVFEPKINTIFAEPFVRYNKNLGAEKMDRVIRFSNAPSTTFSSSYVEAESGVFGETEKRIYWDKCNTLWKKCGQINIPPAELTDLQWANTGDGSADAVAKEYITSWIDWQLNPSIEFKTHLLIVKDWELLHRFNLQIPHHTNNAVVECVVTKIVIDPNSPYTASIRATVYSETIPADFYWQDSFSTTVPVYNDSYTLGDSILDSM